jgi:hypothetical protein
MASRSSIAAATLALLTLGAGKRDAGHPAPAPARQEQKKQQEPPAELWEFDDLGAPITARGEVRDDLSRAALQQSGAKLEGSMRLVASAHKNGAGGVTLKLSRADGACELYASRSGDKLVFDDARCSFPLFDGQLKSTATCRRISGSARRTKDAVLIEATSPDCTAQPMGLSLEGSAKVEPVVEVR